MTADPAAPALPRGIDPRGPRVAAALTSVVLVAVLLLWTGPAALALLAAQAVVFAWSAAAGGPRSPYGWAFRTLVRPRLAPPRELEDPRPPRFAQLVGLVITGLGVLLGVVGVAWAVPVAAALALVAALLNAVFGLCLGCELYLLLHRIGAARGRSA